MVREFIPYMVRHRVYAYLEMKEIMTVIQFLSKKDYSSVFTSKILDQDKPLRVDFDYSDGMKAYQVKKYVEMCSSIKVIINQWDLTKSIILLEFFKQAKINDIQIKLKLFVHNITLLHWLRIFRSLDLDNECVSHITLEVAHNYSLDYKSDSILNMFKQCTSLKIVNLSKLSTFFNGTSNATKYT